MSTAYAKVTAGVVDELRRIVGASYVIADDPEKLEPFSHDETAEARYTAMPEAVVRPASTDEVAAVMKLASRERIPVTPRGAGSGLSCGAVPVFGGVVLSLDRMNRILDVDEKNMTVTVEPGVVTSEIDKRVNEAGLFFAGYPMSLETCFIGGNVAENAGGGKAVKYGVTGRYVLGLEAVLPSGEVLALGGKRVKDVTGYDLIHLLVGSEGTLAVFTKVILKLLPMPQASVSLLVLFHTVQDAIDAVPAVMTETGIIPTAVEFMDELSFRASCEYLNESLSTEAAGAMLLIEIDGSDAGQVERDYDAVGQLCLDRGAIEVYVADNHTTRERIWRIRRNVAEAFKVVSPVQSLEDIVVPTSSIPDLMPELARISERHGVAIPSYGHAGDGNLHATPVKPPAMPQADWDELLPHLLTELYRAVGRLGGTISGEHGIGSKRRAFLPLVLDETTLELMRRIKHAFDPNGILNPGKII
ncbi:MAG: FAD-linked oxidase C-terminal domain-containing protein [Planctomycetota bacterium]